MSGEIQATYQAGKTVYALVRNSQALIWNGSAFVTYVTANYANYPILLTEQGTVSAFYAGNFPVTAVAGTYGIIAKQQIGGSPAETDPAVSMNDLQWGGTGALSLADMPTSGQLARFLPMRIYFGEMTDFPFKLVSATDHVTPFTSGVVSGQISRNGGAFGALQSGIFTEIGLGWYKTTLTSGDLAAKTVAVVFTANGISGGSSDSRDFGLVLQRTSGGGV